MAFSRIVGQEEAVGFLRGVLERGRIPSAFLFSGPHHVGKRTTALTLAKTLNCDSRSGDSCGTCDSCRKIDADTHPDVETVAPDGQNIKIDQVRAISEKLALYAFQAGKRVVIFSRAERMNLQAANALLKTLEEPPPDTLLILCAEDGARLPETVVSRCLPVRFRPLSEAQVRSILERDGTADGPALDFSVRFSQGRLRPELPGRAQQWMQIRDDMIQGLQGLHRPIFAQLSQEISRWSAGEDWRFVLEWLESWFHDLALLDGGAGESRLINGDRMEALEDSVRRFSASGVQHCYRKVLDTRDGILMNANKALALESLWLGIKHQRQPGGIPDKETAS